MALKLKQYKNGIFGLKCGGYYVVPNSSDESKYDVLNYKKNEIVSQGYSDIEDAQWYIKYQELNPHKKELFEKIAKLPIWQYSEIIGKYIRGESISGNPEEDEWLYKTVIALQHRKKDFKPEIPGDDTSYQKLYVEKEDK